MLKCEHNFVDCGGGDVPVSLKGRWQTIEWKIHQSFPHFVYKHKFSLAVISRSLTHWFAASTKPLSIRTGMATYYVLAGLSFPQDSFLKFFFIVNVTEL